MQSDEEKGATQHKYEIGEEHEWADVKEAWEDIEDTAYVDEHTVEIVHQYGDDPMWDKRKYEVHISHTERGPKALYAVPHRWKGNYWRRASDMDDWVDWMDLPYLVRRKVAQLVACDNREELAPLDGDERLVNPEVTADAE